MSSFGQGFCGIGGLGIGTGRAGALQRRGGRGAALDEQVARDGAGARGVRAMGMRGTALGGSVAYCAAVWGCRSGENRSPAQRVDSGFRRNDGEN